MFIAVVFITDYFKKNKFIISHQQCGQRRK